jgi:hypothetical protein
MKHKAIIVRQIIFISIMLIFTGLDGFSQGTDLRSRRKQSFYFGFNICPTKTSIINGGTSTISALSSTKKNSLSGNIEVGYFFSGFFGLATGIGYSAYTSNISLGVYNNSYDTVDSDTPRENYTRNISGRNIMEIQKISMLNVPLLINFRIPINEVFGFYSQTGVNLSIPIKSNYSSSGVFTYEGYYPSYNLNITGIPYEGFEKDYNNSAQGGLKIKSFNTEFITSAGASFTLLKKMQISIGVLYTKMLSDISDYASTDKFRLSSVPGQMKSTMEGSPKVTASSMGVRLGIRFYIY